MKLDTRQKILITLIILAFAFVAWQLYDIFAGGDNVPVTKPATVVPAQPSKPTAATPTGAPIQLTNAPIAPATPNATTINVPSVSSIPVQRKFSLPASTPFQEQYMRLLDQYQLVKLQRMVVDEQTAIAAGQAKIAQINETLQKTGAPVMPTTSNLLPSTSSSETSYKLVYIDNQAGQWTATISRNGQLQEINVGSILTDGSRVIRISQKGVVLQRGGKRYLLSFYGLTVIRMPEPEVTAAPYSRPVVETKPSKAPAPIVKAAPVTMTAPTQPAATKTASAPTANKVNKTTNAFAIPATAPTITPAPASKPLPTISNKPASNAAAIPSIPNNSTSSTNVSTLTPQTKQLLANNNNASLNNAALNFNAPAQPTTTAPSPTASTNSATTNQTVSTPTANNMTNQINPKSTSTLSAYPTPKPNTATATAPAMAPVVSATSQTNANSLKLSAEQQTKVAQLSATNAANADHSYTEAEQTLLKMPTDSYTIQLMGSRDKNDLKDLVKQYQLKDTYVFETTYLEKPWFVLVYGSFKSAQTANVAIKQLPKPVQALKVWVRPMTSVQNAIKRNS